MILKIVLLFAGTILAFWISAICGGGASLILIPILNLLLPTSLVPFSLTIGTFTSSASRIAVFKKHVNWKIFLWFVPFSIPAVLLGAYLIKYVNPNYLQLLVAFFLIANLPQLFASKNKKEESEKPYPKSALALIGFLAGFISGITGAVGLLFNRFYLKFGLKKEEIVATRAANEVFLHLIKLIIYISLGLYSNTALWMGIAIAVGAIVSSYTVKYILPHLSENMFKKIGYAAMVVSGITLFTSTSGKIVQQDQIVVNRSSTKNKSVYTMSWKNTRLVVEYKASKGLEIEKTVQPDELSGNLKQKYDQLMEHYDDVQIEKVYAFGKETIHEFYCYKDNVLTKFKA
ncbi:sulfite exporter TauE/SafE family protein [Chryseobacterium lactis]|uniref:Probable membrane transporter protein n=1 Tax=Chryseobacterium lactis TaxID=1241981 RepID=A0A3G6RLF2_CHRLC|nr:sulfite exporter TauE/SafE family protein [Chryseobacterium lactis]AZA83654.1 sulfite exporter TauE/SafE family protein [Chryseobacterium lactis]AZB04039.1 sulfite exporter TauE/SafE family protein [Chryseobacterium lactis]PNW13052.1 sulfite exporter TauE/SafE family protein [Chryseobacterium lactis]